MPTNDERREVAARLRAIDDTEWTHPREELRALDEALGTAQGMPYALQTTWERFADLIEPEPERTCRPKEWLSFLSGTDCPAWECSECGDLFEAYANYCSNCGAKVVQE
jgi:rubrerythrin